MGPTEKLARFIVDIRYDQIPQGAITLAKRSILDCIGICLGGRVMPEGKIMVEYLKQMGGSPESVVIGGGFKAPAPLAAFANGIMASSLNWADSSFTWNQGHPTPVIMPAVLALGEKCRISGKQAIEAYIIGFEVGSRIGSGLTRHYELGWLTTTTVGTLAATAAAARILKLDVHQTRMALGIAGDTVSGLILNFGAMHSFSAGKADRDGVIAASLAQKGFTANPSILEGPIGLAQLLTCGEYDLDKMDRGLGSSFDILAPGGLCLKYYPTGHLSHWCIDGILYLKNEYHIKAEDVVEVICRMPPVFIKTLRYNLPQTALEAKISTQYPVAAALLYGEVSSKLFTDDQVKRPEVQELMTRIKCVPNEAVAFSEQCFQPHIVTVKLKNGKEYSRKVDYPKGDPRNPLTDEEINTKFREVASPTATPEQITRILDACWRLESLPSLSELTDLLIIGKEG